jgi:hypothetical protein
VPVAGEPEMGTVADVTQACIGATSSVFTGLLVELVMFTSPKKTVAREVGGVIRITKAATTTTAPRVYRHFLTMLFMFIALLHHVERFPVIVATGRRITPTSKSLPVGNAGN